jgi:hypothetical protein
MAKYNDSRLILSEKDGANEELKIFDGISVTIVKPNY